MSSFLESRPGDTYGSRIRKENAYDGASYTYYPVAILGAGESGIAMGCQLKEKLGFDQFRIFERQSGLGGTWFSNRYPGVACDIPAIFYSFSFFQNPNWTSFHPTGPEIVKYLQDVCEQYQIMDKIQLNTEVAECRWNEKEEVWDITLKHFTFSSGDLTVQERNAKIKDHGRAAVYTHEEKIRAKVIISAVGGFVEPKQWPDHIPGKETFQGEIFHSARWKPEVNLKDKDVIVIGTGCSAAQFVPILTSEHEAKSVTQLMRSPPWVVPRAQPPFMPAKMWEENAPWLNRNVPGFMKSIRFLISASMEYDWRLFGSSPYHEKERAKSEAVLIEHLKRTVPQKYHEILTPNYSLGCKRRIYDASWFSGLNDPRIELTTLPLTSVSERSVTLGPGRNYPDPKNTNSNAPNEEVTLPADVIILANGFETNSWLHPINIVGRDGKKLYEVFDERGGPQMYMGTALDGFPSFFCIFGPNTATGHTSVILATENMVMLVLKLIKPILSGDVACTEIKKQAELDWAEDTQRALKKTVWHTGGCNNWYKTENDWNSMTYPYTQIRFGLRCMFPTWSDWDLKYTPKGLAKKRRQTILKYLTLFTAVTGLWQLKRTGQDFSSLPAIVKASLKYSLQQGASVLEGIGGRL